MAFGRPDYDDGRFDRRRGFTNDDDFNKEIVVPFRSGAIREVDFSPAPYSQIEVARDQAEVARVEQSGDDSGDRSSEGISIEYVAMAGIKLYGWFGDEVEGVRKTARYDDVWNGVDLVVTFEDEDGKLVNLGVDTTTNPQRAALEKKLRRVLDRAPGRKLSTVKYFEDVDGNRGPARMPLVILGTDSAKTVELQKLFVEVGKDDSKKILLELAPIQMVYLTMAERQLIAIVDYALRKNRVIAPGGSRPKNTDELFERLATIPPDSISRIPDLEKFILAHVDVLKAIQRAKKEKSLLGDGSREQAEDPIRFLGTPEEWKGLER